MRVIRKNWLMLFLTALLVTGLMVGYGRKKEEVVQETKDYSTLISEWQDFYQGLGIKVDFSNLQIPGKQQGFNRLIIVAEGMTPQFLYDKCKGLFLCGRWTDKSLDEVVTSDRTAKNNSYAVWVRNRVEADEELKNLSANDLKKKSIPGITLEERLIYELKYFQETGEHLDIDHSTLCSGSRCSVTLSPAAAVPNVGWGDGFLLVYYFYPDDAFPSLRARQVVS